MLRFTILGLYSAVLAIVLLAVVAAGSDLEKKCTRLGNQDIMLCCKSGLPTPKVDPDKLFKECMELPRVPHSCEPDICIAKKRGYASSDSGDAGDINMEAFKKILAKDFDDFPDLTTEITKNCINRDIYKFASFDHEVCLLMKRCIHEQAVKACKEWDDTVSCAGTKELVKECEQLMI